MYHDQGLPVLKYSGFEQAVNLTLGLPYPRVAVDHGTALDLAGTGQRRSVQPVRRDRHLRALAWRATAYAARRLSPAMRRRDAAGFRRDRPRSTSASTSCTSAA